MYTQKVRETLRQKYGRAAATEDFLDKIHESEEQSKAFLYLQHVHEILIASVSLRFDEDGSLVAYSGA